MRFVIRFINNAYPSPSTTIIRDESGVRAIREISLLVSIGNVVVVLLIKIKEKIDFIITFQDLLL